MVDCKKASTRSPSFLGGRARDPSRNRRTDFLCATGGKGPRRPVVMGASKPFLTYCTCTGFSVGAVSQGVKPSNHSLLGWDITRGRNVKSARLNRGSVATLHRQLSRYQIAQYRTSTDTRYLSVANASGLFELNLNAQTVFIPRVRVVCTSKTSTRTAKLRLTRN